ncbi:cytochrome P450 family protein [Roseicella frigidaeris]|uniref:Cytochrome P450 n=1 Tax=Roseicella frigidaeris TaxID=2230885 RepID=A0A327MBP6_9PROT|nr:cytochrome P450 [Roseicella frigidaeris]RAI59473.1 cytochrome P450 [Roseicella frigidaeris]
MTELSAALPAHLAPAPAPEPGGRIAAWLRRHMDLGFRILRTVAPILRFRLKGQRWAVVTRAEDVEAVLRRPDVFDVPYAPKIATVMQGGNIFLGMPATEEARRDKANMRLTAPSAEARARIGPETARLAAGLVEQARPRGRLDLAMELTQAATTRLYLAYFGLADLPERETSDQARALFGYMFASPLDDPARHAAAEPVAAALRGRVEAAIAARRGARGAQEDVLERCLRLQEQGLPGFTDREIRNNLIGLVVGALPQAPMLVPQLFDLLLDRPRELAAAQAAARADDEEALARIVFEAARFRPLTPGLFRLCREDHRLAAGHWRGRTIRAGTIVMAATRSAMMDGRRVPAPREFRTDRPDPLGLHFGLGQHECFGIHMNRVMLPQLCKPVLRLPGLRRAPGEEGRLRLDAAFGIFPMNLTVAFD